MLESSLLLSACILTVLKKNGIITDDKRGKQVYY